MPPSFHPRLVNGPFDDPALFIARMQEKRAILFDLGELSALSAKDILKISHVFVTHTHMDHFAGFDTLLRIFLGREKTLYIFGPEGFLKNVEGKLSGYTWNLVRRYAYRFVLEATEVRPDILVTRRYSCQTGFEPEDERTSKTVNGILLQTSSFSVSCIILDHKIPCLAFRLSENFHININKNQVEKMGLAMGPWLNEFKKAIYDKKDPRSLFSAPQADKEKPEKIFHLGKLAQDIAITTTGQILSYITDVVFSEENVKKIIPFCRDSDHLFIEACFLEKDREIALRKHHLTAAQAGYIGRESGAKILHVFHFSPRYSGKGRLLEKEADVEFRGESEGGVAIF